MLRLLEISLKDVILTLERTHLEFLKLVKLQNPYLIEHAQNFCNLEIIFVIEDIIVFKLDEKIIQFSKISQDTKKLKPKDKLSSCQI